MRSNFRFITVAALLAILLCAVTVSFTSCYQAPPTIINPVDDPNTTTTASLTDEPQADTEETYATRPTVAVPESKLTLSKLVNLYDVTMPWSAIESYDHEMTSDNTAHFVVADGYGTECSLDVVIDWDNGLLTEATLTYGDASESILTYSLQGINRIMLLMSKAE